MTKIPTVSEKGFCQAITDLAGHTGWTVFHAWSSQHSPAGFPDLTLCREKADGTAELVYLELKSERGKLTERQRFWLYILGRVPGVVARCVRPSDWDEVVKLLERPTLTPQGKANG